MKLYLKKIIIYISTFLLGKFNFEKHDAVYAKRQSATMVPLNMSILSTAASVHNAQNRHSPTNDETSTPSNPPTSSGATAAIYLGKSAPIFFANPAAPAGPAGPASEPPREHREDARNQASVSAQEEMEKQMAEEEENAAQEAAEREHAATAFLEEAYRRRNHGSGRPEKVSGNENGAGSCSSRSGSVMGVNSGPSSSPGSQSPSPPVSAMQPVLNHLSSGAVSRISNPDPDSKSNSSNGSRSPTDAITMRKPWKKRHYEVVDQDPEENSRINPDSRSSSSDKKRAKTHKIPTENRAKSSHDLENNYRSESSHDPISTSSGSPDQVEDLISEASVSPDNEKN